MEQEPIIFSDTVKSNVIFGKQFDQQRYDSAVRMSCLKDDFNLLPEGDQTVVGERGTTLSGGQKARVSLARALYSDADIYLMDDPISAVDAKVAKQIFDKCLRPLGKSKTVLLVTHQIGYITECEEVIVMNDGAIQAAGDSASLKTILN